MPRVSSKPYVSTINIDENGVVYYVKYNRTIGTVTNRSGAQEVALYIQPHNLVNGLWPRKETISFYRNLSKVIKDIKKQGFYITGGIWFPNLEKGTLNTAYDVALAAAPGLEEPKPAKRTYKPRKAKGVPSGQGQEEVREESLA